MSVVKVINPQHKTVSLKLHLKLVIRNEKLFLGFPTVRMFKDAQILTSLEEPIKARS